jgi:hypothetical protein
MQTFVEVIDALGGPTAVAAAIGTTQQNVTNMKARNSIPANFWKPLVEAAHERGKSEITLDLLAQIAHVRSAPPPLPPSPPAAAPSPEA